MKDFEEERAKRRREEYENAGINDRLIFCLRDLSHVMRALYEGKGSQKRIAMVLDSLGGSITQRELTERLGIQPGSASEVIAKLETAGYLCRTPSEEDRRTADVHLTEAGRAFAQEARQQRIRRHEDMFSCLSEEEKETLLGLLEKVNRDWETRYPGVPEKQRKAHGRGGEGHSRDVRRHRGR